MSFSSFRLFKIGLWLLFLTPLVPFLKYLGLGVITPLISILDRFAVLLIVSYALWGFKKGTNKLSFLLIVFG